MTVKFAISGSNVYVININEELVQEALTPKVYTVQFHPMQGYFLAITKDKLQLPEKIYGKAPSRVKKCIATYKSRPSSTGILLTGDKGTGKTLLTALIANAAISELNLPVILIKEPYAGEQFVSFIESLGECCLMFDEFGKMFERGRDEERPSQEQLLSLFDGVDKTKRLILLTENNTYDVNDYMLNRPSRIYYHFKYHKLDEDSIKEYCKDFGMLDQPIEDILEVSRRSKIFSFDMLQSIVEEHIRTEETISECIQDLNIDIREETTKSLEILSVYDTATKEVFPVVGSNIVAWHSHDWMYVKVNNPNADRDDELDFLDDKDVDPIKIVQWRDRDLAYDKQGTLFFEQRGYTIVARLISISPVYSYEYE